MPFHEIPTGGGGGSDGTTLNVLYTDPVSGAITDADMGDLDGVHVVALSASVGGVIPWQASTQVGMNDPVAPNGYVWEAKPITYYYSEPSEWYTPSWNGIGNYLSAGEMTLWPELLAASPVVAASRTWEAATAYVANEAIYADGAVWVCTVGGTSDATAPTEFAGTDPETGFGTTAVDGTAEWSQAGRGLFAELGATVPYGWTGSIVGPAGTLVSSVYISTFNFDRTIVRETGLVEPAWDPETSYEDGDVVWEFSNSAANVVVMGLPTQEQDGRALKFTVYEADGNPGVRFSALRFSPPFRLWNPGNSVQYVYRAATDAWVQIEFGVD